MSTDDNQIYIRFIASEIEAQSPLISAFGGLESLCFTCSKIEWVDDKTEDIIDLEHNYSQVFCIGFLRPTTDAAAIREFTSLIERSLIDGMRYAGSLQAPSLAGGILYFLTAKRGAHIVDGGGTTLLISDVEDVLRELPARPELVLVCGTRAAAYLKKMKWSKVPHLSCHDLPKTDVLFLRKESIRIGYYAPGEPKDGLGRPHILLHAPNGGQTLYADLSFVVRDVEKMGRLTGFKVELPGGKQNDPA